MMKPLALIVCCAKNGVIGVNGHLPWNEPEELQYFKKITMGHCLIMGRVTWESFEGALEGRECCVLTRQNEYKTQHAHVFHSLDEALLYASTKDSMPIICGGEEVYQHAMPYVTRAYVSVLPYEAEGDRTFPLDYIDSWEICSCEENNGIQYRVYERM